MLMFYTYYVNQQLTTVIYRQRMLSCNSSWNVHLILKSVVGLDCSEDEVNSRSFGIRVGWYPFVLYDDSLSVNHENWISQYIRKQIIIDFNVAFYFILRKLIVIYTYIYIYIYVYIYIDYTYYTYILHTIYIYILYIYYTVIFRNLQYHNGFSVI